MNKTTMLSIFFMVIVSSIVFASYNIDNLGNDDLLRFYLPFNNSIASIINNNVSTTSFNYTSYFNDTEYCVVGSSATPLIYMGTYYVNNSLVYNLSTWMYSTAATNIVRFNFYYINGGYGSVDVGGCQSAYCASPSTAYHPDYTKDISRIELYGVFNSALTATTCVKNTTFYFPPNNAFTIYGIAKTQYHNVNGRVWSNGFAFWGNNSVEGLKNQHNTSQTLVAFNTPIFNDNGVYLDGVNQKLNVSSYIGNIVNVYMEYNLSGVNYKGVNLTNMPFRINGGGFEIGINSTGNYVTTTINKIILFNRVLSSDELTILNGSGNFTTDIKNIASSSLYLNGNEYIEISNISFSSNSAVRSICYWLQRNNTGGSEIFYFNNRQDYLLANNSLTLSNLYYVGVVPVTWTHVCNVEDGTNTKTYINGILTSSLILNNTIVTNDHFVIGKYYPNNDAYYTGKIDEFLYYTKALTANEVLTLYNGYNNSLTLNFYDERTRSLWNDIINLDIISSNISYSYDGYSNQIFVNTFSGNIDTLRYSSPTSYERFHYVNISNISSNSLNLYLINESYATNITYTVYDNNNNLVEGAYIDTMRFFIENSSYVSVAQGKTDSNGKTIIPLEYNAEFYKVLVYYPFSTLQQESSPAYITSVNQIIQINTIPLPGRLFNATIGISSPGISYNNATTTFTYTFSNVQGTNTVSELNVYKTSPRGTTLVNSSSVVASAGTLVVPIPLTNGSSYIAVSSVNYSIGGVTYKYVTNSYDLTQYEESNTGNQGIFFAWLLTITMIFVGYFSIQAMIILLPIPLLLFAIFGLVNIGVPILVAIEVGAIILAVIISN